MVLSFEELQRQYGGLFIAIKNDEVVLASDKSYNIVMKKIEKMNKTGVNIRFIRAKIQTPEVKE